MRGGGGVAAATRAGTPAQAPIEKKSASPPCGIGKKAASKESKGATKEGKAVKLRASLGKAVRVKRAAAAAEASAALAALAGAALPTVASALPMAVPAAASSPAEGVVPSVTFAMPAPRQPKMSVSGTSETRRRLLEKPLPEKAPEDNYEISDKEDTDDEDEENQESRRANKVVPSWCADYQQKLAAQEGVDPDSIFSSRVPFCDLDAIFTDALYQQYGKKAPKRKRGSSCQWHKDRLSATEIARYRAKMGQQKRWSSLRKQTLTIEQ